MLWAAACMCFIGFLQCSEVVISSNASYDPQVNLSLEDIQVDSQVKPSYVEVNIKASKTDPFCQGLRVYLGATSRDIYPVSAILCYLALRGAGPGPFFKFRDGKGLTREWFVSAVRVALSSGGGDASSYVGHSFRIGDSYNSGKGWNTGLTDLNFGTMGEFSIPSLH